MDILHLIDRLEALLNEGSHPPLTKKVLIDEQRAWEMIDQMRIAIPDEVKKAKRINQERDRIIAQANEEGTRMIDLAKEEAGRLTIDSEVTKAAQTRANTIVERAQREAEALRLDADDYTLQVLGKLDEDLAKALSIVRNGLIKLGGDHADAPGAQSTAIDSSADRVS
ncbi:MAG TPA: ATPase [Anaerolineae bacterium]|nr:ATPase [Anaerolineae bacterium]